ncbi:protein of unknown function [Candidatus Filomicrobium marinum]|uniref:Uncharacterized protein n=1 Tax=Candidatus Filomicrobium marinum TaxID=1608628 RepID=A0A0D6JJV1_9HYPH|nr:protein of unknown function [Candidatus Filomicrobium marinum]CPR22269.1 protein of unknown function [Candidatus Filomicrobium marinum]
MPFRFAGVLLGFSREREVLFLVCDFQMNPTCKSDAEFK